MKKAILAFAIVTASFAANAQTGKNQLSVGPEIGLSTTSGGGTAFGGTAKYMHGVGKAGQVTLTSGYLFDSETEGGIKVTSSQIPVLVGYRHYFSGLFVEPQAGYISSTVKIKDTDTGDSFSVSDGAFGYAIGGGYALPAGLDLGVSFRNTTQTGATGAIVFRAAWNFNLGGSAK
jgi:hypothetical protein